MHRDFTGFSGYATRFADPALGFALGWNYLMKYLIVTPNNINAAGVVIRYWDVNGKVHIAVWMVILIALSKHSLCYFRPWLREDLYSFLCQPVGRSSVW